MKNIILYLKWFLGFEDEPYSVTWEAYVWKVRSDD